MTGLKFSPDIQHRLLDVLAYDTEIIQINRTVARINDALVAHRESEDYLSFVRVAEDWTERLDEATERCERLESDIKVAHDRIARDRAREKESTDSKELTALEHEIESLERRIAALEEQELEALTERDEISGQQRAALIARDSFHDRTDAERLLREGERAEIEARKTTVERARAAVVSEIPTELMELYERQRERYGFGASHLHAGVSSASGVTLTQGQLQEIRTASPDDVILCPDSNAILIRTPESGL